MPDADVSALPEGFDPVVPYGRSFDGQFGLVIVTADTEGDGGVQSRVPVTDAVRDVHGNVHGGVYAAVGESIASHATALAAARRGRMAMGLSNDTTVVADVRQGTVHSDARVQARGPDAWVWTVHHRDDDGRVCALTRVTVAVR